MRTTLFRPGLAAALGILTLMSGPLAPGAHAQSTAEDLRQMIGDDLTVLGVNLPVWMSQHITSVMAPVGLGAGSGIGDDSGGFSLGVLTRLGLFNNFDDVGHGLKLVDIQNKMPSLVPWPQFGVVVGGNLGDGIEIGADVQFIPAMDVAAADLRLKASLISVGATLRWRVNKADGAVPAFVLGIGGAYYNGSFEIGGGYSESYSETIDGHVVTGRVKIDTAPGVSWSVFQASPEVRLAWDIGGVFRPYVGLGLGLSFGTVGDELSVRAEASIDTIDGQATNQDPVVYEDKIVLYETDPALWTLRPHVGFDLVMGVIAFTAQLDLALMGKEEISANFAEGAGSFDTTDPNFLFNENARSSQTQAALIATFALRAQF